MSASRPPDRIRRLKEYLLRIVLVGVALAAVLGICEAVFRLAGHHILRGGEWISIGAVHTRNDPPVGFSLIPGASRLMIKGESYLVADQISSQGLRDVEHSLDPQPGVPRILILGDSFMYGEGVRMEENMPRQLAALMGDVEIINTGVPGYALGQEYIYYKERGRRFKPDLVLLSFFINDLAAEKVLQVTTAPTGLPVSYQRRPDDLAEPEGLKPSSSLRGTVTSWLERHSLLYVMVRKRLSTLGGGKSRPTGPRPSNAAETPYLFVFQGNADDELSPEWAQAYAILDELKRLVSEDHARLAAIVVPAAWQTSDQEWNAWVTWLGVDATTLRRSRPQTMMMAWCARTQTPCLDLLGTFQNVDRHRFFLKHDLHWTAEGNQVAAQAVAEFLRRNDLP